MGSPLPDWTTDEILAVHMRMHHAEGALFWESLAQGASGLRTLRIPEKQAQSLAEKQLSIPLPKLQRTIADLGRSVGAPWAADQKSAALAAMIALA